MNKVIEEAKIEEVTGVEEIPVETLVEKPYTLRRLKDKDLFPLLRILKKIGLKNFKEAFMQVADGKKTLKEIGALAVLDMADIFVSNIESAETEIYELWSDISGIEVEAMKDMEFGTLPLMIYDSFSEVKDTSFFKVLFRSL